MTTNPNPWVFQMMCPWCGIGLVPHDEALICTCCGEEFPDEEAPE